MLGSTRGDGGRFNIGATLNPATYTPFPALYLAEDFPTAFRERFGVNQTNALGDLTANELVLRRESSFSKVTLDVNLESVIDVGDLSKLKAIADILGKMQMPPGVGVLARKLRLRTPGLIRTAAGLQRQLLSSDWRVEPSQHDLPSNSQIFGRLCLAAGIHGILYPSVRSSEKSCLALFPQNWSGSTSVVEIVWPCPPEVGVRRLDGATTVS
jgi:RES domain-containing protein